MDKAVLERTSHTERIVHENKSTEVKVEFLTSAEKETLAFLHGLKNDGSNAELATTSSPDTKLNRLEQEKLDDDIVIKALKAYKLL